MSAPKRPFHGFTEEEARRLGDALAGSHPQACEAFLGAMGRFHAGFLSPAEFVQALDAFACAVGSGPLAPSARVYLAELYQQAAAELLRGVQVEVYSFGKSRGDA